MPATIAVSAKADEAEPLAPQELLEGQMELGARDVGHKDARRARRLALTALGGIFGVAGTATAFGLWHPSGLAGSAAPQGRVLEEWETIPEAASIIQRAEVLELLNEEFQPYTAKELKVERTMCVMDTMQATAYLGQAVVAIRNAVASSEGRCPDMSASGCAVNVAGAVTALAWVASYVSLAASSCADHMNPKADCAADWTAIVADFGEIATSGAGVGTNCDFSSSLTPSSSGSGPRPAESGGDDKFAKQLAALEAKKAELMKKLQPSRDPARAIAGVADNLAAATEDRSYDIAMCTFDGVQVAAYIVRVITGVRLAAEDCEDKEQCAIDVLNVISSFGWISQFTALAISHCGEGSNQAASCASDISDFVAASTSLTASAMAQLNDCEH